MYMPRADAQAVAETLDFERTLDAETWLLGVQAAVEDIVGTHMNAAGLVRDFARLCLLAHGELPSWVVGTHLSFWYLGREDGTPYSP